MRVWDVIVREALQTMARNERRAVSGALSQVYERPELDEGRQEIEASIRREVLSDFLDMAARFLQQVGLDYRTAAAFAGILAGATLEEYVRTLADTNGITVTDSSGEPVIADSLNAELCSDGGYGLIEEMQVRAWIELRNKADHARRDEFTADEVRLMIEGLRDLMIRHPG